MPVSPAAHRFPELYFLRLQGVLPYMSTSFTCQKTFEDHRHSSGALSLHSFFSLIFYPNPASLELYLQAFGSQGPLGKKLGWSGTNLCTSLLSRDIVLHFLLSNNWKWLLFLSYDFAVTYARNYSGPICFIIAQNNCLVLFVKFFFY